MTAEQILGQLKELGQESYKKVIMKHGIPEPVYGVKIEEIKKIVKQIKNGHNLSLKLYDSGIYDAMYLAGLVTEPEKMTEEQLQNWAEKANSPSLREYTVAWVAAEGPHAMKKAMEWIDSKNEHLQSIGWSVLGNLVSLKADADLDIPLLTKLLKRVVKDIHNSANRVKLAMNGFVIALGIYVQPLNEAAKKAAGDIGKVTADMGDTACKIPAAAEYIGKAEQKNAIGKKKKSARCL
jgi:3-methyladenine DNA glycosylase AlkD